MQDLPLQNMTLHRFAQEQYYRTRELGWFDNQRVEQLDGLIIDCPSQTNTHAVAIALVHRALQDAFGESVVLGSHSGTPRFEWVMHT